jgi:hypothetical protein
MSNSTTFPNVKEKKMWISSLMVMELSNIYSIFHGILTHFWRIKVDLIVHIQEIQKFENPYYIMYQEYVKYFPT